VRGDAGGVWFAFVAGALLTVAAAGCGQGGGVTGPSEAPTAQEAITAPLRVPDRLVAVWSGAGAAPGLVGRYEANTVLLLIDTWAEDLTPYATWARERGVGAIPFVEQCFTAPRSSWDACWTKVEAWAAPLRAAGLLWGFHVMDEPSRSPLTAAMRDEANAYVRARGYDVLATEIMEDLQAALEQFEEIAGDFGQTPLTL